MTGPFITIQSGYVWLSSRYSASARPDWRRLLWQFAESAALFALASAGRSKLARIAMIAMTTSNSTSVKPERSGRLDEIIRRVTITNRIRGKELLARGEGQTH